MTLQPRCIIASPNYIEPQVTQGVTATVTTTTPACSNGSWSASFPLTNLALGKFYQPIRSTDATNASTKFDVDFGEAKPLLVVALIRHNLTPVVGSSRVRISVSNDPTFATSLNVPAWANAYQPFFATGSLPAGWDPAVWTAAPFQSDLQHYKSLAYTAVLDAVYLARYLRVEVDDTGNSAGYVQIGGCFAGPGFQPPVNMTTGFTLGWLDDSTVVAGEGGVRFYTVRPRYRQASLVMDVLSPDQGLEFAFELHGRLGISGDCYFVADPTSANHMHRGSFPCTLQEMSPLEYPYALYTQQAYKLIEKL